MSSLGSYLKREREQRQVSVAELAQTTRIPVRILHQLENDELGTLPADVFVRGFLRAYARALGVDEEHVLARYGGRQTPEPPPTLPAAYAPESGRRFGIAIALFILLILFTLALSIVLRPRHRDAPLELSRSGVIAPALRGDASADMPCAVEPKSPKLFCSAASITATPTASSRC
jgi:transcriptional regulator with XRE-family HTH domain